MSGVAVLGRSDGPVPHRSSETSLSKGSDDHWRVSVSTKDNPTLGREIVLTLVTWVVEMLLIFKRLKVGKNLCFNLTALALRCSVL